MEKVLTLNFDSSLSKLCEKNSSFDTGVLKIAYAGTNRNHSSISKDVFEKCKSTMFNCPIVCNYDRETDTLGGHDMEIVCDDDGTMRLVNITHPIGFIPEGAKTWWQKVEEDNGEEHEYLFADVLLWKRQEAYKKIKEDGIVSHSMEIKVKGGEMVDGVLHINDFEFNAFCLIGVDPCFESSSLETFSRTGLKEQIAVMMREFQKSFNLVNTSLEVDNISYDKNSLKGGEEVLNTEEIIEELGTDKVGDSENVAGAAVEAFAKVGEDNSAEQEQGENESFELNRNVVDELNRALGVITSQREWGECRRYRLEDYDTDASRVYCWDIEDWLLYGFSYSLSGDTVVIDFESKKRMKFSIEEFVDGTDQQGSPFVEAFNEVSQKAAESKMFEAKLNEKEAEASAMKAELDDLRKYKADAEAAKMRDARNAVFSKFEDLFGIEAFEELKANCEGYSVEALEEKCFAIRGRQSVATAKFSLEQKSPKIVVCREETDDKSDEPYGGLFLKYGNK